MVEPTVVKTYPVVVDGWSLNILVWQVGDKFYPEVTPGDDWTGTPDELGSAMGIMLEAMYRRDQPYDDPLVCIQETQLKLNLGPKRTAQKEASHTS